MNSKISYDIINSTNTNFYVKHKGGLEYQVSKMSNFASYEEAYLVVVVKGEDVNSVRVNSARGLTKLDKLILSNLEYSLERKKEENLTWNYKEYDLRIKVDLTREVWEEEDTYHSELLGCTIYVGDCYRETPALNTPGMTINALKEKISRWDGLATGVYMNDPEGEFDQLFTNLYGRVFKVPVVKDVNQPSGVYIFPPNNPGNSKGQYHSFERLNNKLLSELGLYKSRVEAGRGEVAESVNRLHKEINDLRTNNDKQRLVIEKQEQELNKHQFELTSLKSQHKLELASLKSLFDIQKQETKLKELSTKNQLEVTKTRLEENNIGSLVKALTVVGGIGLGAYKAYQNWSE